MFVMALSVFVVPAIIHGEILQLKDGSEIRGKIVVLRGDTLTFAPAFGGEIRVYRGDIARIVFDESFEPRGEPAAKAAAATGAGTISLVFKDDKVTSKLKVRNKSKQVEKEMVRGNWIEQTLVVGPDTVFTRVDTTMEKTIYKGHDKVFKNTIGLENIQAVVEAGVYRCVLIVRNLGSETYKGDFEEGPLDMSLEFGTVSVMPGQTTPLKVGIKKGFLKLGSPQFYPVE